MSDKFYNIDWNKIERAEDIVAILAAINFNFNEHHPRLHLVDHLLDKDNPIVVDNVKPSLKLPKLPKLDDENEDGSSGL